jgi:arginyl-tRNA synthetase
LESRHLRSTILGACIANLYKNMGWDVVKINYLGDWGKQMGLLGVGWEKFGSEEQFRADPIRHMLSVYRKIDELLRPEVASRKMAWDYGENTLAMEVQGVFTERDTFFKRIEDGDKEALAICRRFRDASIEYYTKLYASLNVSFDEYSGESQVSLEAMDEVEEMLKSKGLSEESEGAWIGDLQKHGEKTGTVIIRDREGSTTYLLRDLAAVLDRSRKYSFDKMIYVVADQNLHFRHLFKILELLGMSDLARKLQHVHFNKGPQMGHGDILNHCQSAMHKSLKANPDKATLLDDSEYPVAALGISALLAQELLLKRETDYDFNFTKMTSFKGITGPNLQYWYLRLCSMLKATSFDLNDFSDGDFTPIEEEMYTELLRILAHYPEITNSVYRTLEPRSVLLYLAKITDQVAMCLEIKEDPEESSPTPAEAALFESARQVLENGMRLLGIIPDQEHPNKLSNIDSDTTDISSNIESVLSIVAPTVSSKTSIQGGISLFAADEFITLLLGDEELRVLFAAAIQSDSVGPERFERNIRRLLNQYSVDLKGEAERNEERAVVYLIRSRSRYLANDIRRKLTSVKDSDRQYGILTGRSDHKINEAESSERQPEGVNSDSDFEENSADDDITELQNYEKLPKLSMVKDFMITGTAFSAFRENLRQFIQPACRSKLGRLLGKAIQTRA